MCIDPHQTGFVGKGSDHLQLIKFWLSHAPGRGSYLTLPYHAVQSTRRVTLGDCAFPVAAARAWNCLPSSIWSASSLQLFCRELKTVLFSLSFDIQDWLWRQLFFFLFSLLSAPGTVFCDNITLNSTFYNNNNTAPDVLPLSADASNGPNAHPQINRKVTKKSTNAVLTWVHTNTWNHPLPSDGLLTLTYPLTRTLSISQEKGRGSASVVLFLCGLRRGKNFWFSLTTASAQCLRLLRALFFIFCVYVICTTESEWALNAVYVCVVRCMHWKVGSHSHLTVLVNMSSVFTPTQLPGSLLHSLSVSL